MHDMEALLALFIQQHAGLRSHPDKEALLALFIPQHAGLWSHPGKKALLALLVRLALLIHAFLQGPGADSLSRQDGSSIIVAEPLI